MYATHRTDAVLAVEVAVIPKAELKCMRDQLIASAHDRRRANEEIESLRTEQQRVVKKGLAVADALRSRNGQLKQRIEELVTELDVARKRVVELEGEERRRKRRERRSSFDADIAEKARSVAQEQLDGKMEEIKRLQSGCTSLRRRVTRLGDDCSSLKGLYEDTVETELKFRERYNRIISEKDGIIEEGRRTVVELRARVQELELEVQRQAEAMDVQSNEIRDLRLNLGKMTNRWKNRGRTVKRNKLKVLALKQEIKDEMVMMKPSKALKPFAQLSKRQKTNRLQKIKETISKATTRILSNYSMDVKGYGPMEMVMRTNDDDEDVTVVSFNKACNYEDQLKKFVALHDSGISKKKMHELRMIGGVAKSSIPQQAEITSAERALNDEIKSELDIEWDPDFFHVLPESMLRYVLKKRGIKDPERLDVLLMGDGRGTGRSFKSVIFEFRLLNEGRKIYRNDRAYLLSMVKGDEDRKIMPGRMKVQIDALKKLQDKGIVWEGKTIPVYLHLTSDAKFLRLVFGIGPRFCDEGPNCLFCFKTPEEREDPTIRTPEATARTNNRRFTKGQKLLDLFHFIPQHRRWLEQMHMCIRVGHDALIKTGFTEIINEEHDEPGEGCAYIENIMHSPPINCSSFKFRAAAQKDPSAVGGWAYATPKYSTIMKIMVHFDFAGGYKKNRERGSRLQDLIRRWAALYKRTQVYPGDATEDLNADEIFSDHSEWADELVAGGEGLPGREEFEKKGWSLSLVRKFYTHAWIQHEGEQFERSKAYSKYFGAESGEETGGLKPFRTDALERANLMFFHQYFQIFTRKPQVICYEAGMCALRKLFNPVSLDRSKFWCRWCAKGYCQQKSFVAHETACAQGPGGAFSTYGI